MNEKIEVLAEILHNAWRIKKIKIGWHIPEACPACPDDIFKGNCYDCHPCVGKWENLKEKEKELALQNARLAYEYFAKSKEGNVELQQRVLKHLEEHKATTRWMRENKERSTMDIPMMIIVAMIDYEPIRNI